MDRKMFHVTVAALITVVVLCSMPAYATMSVYYDVANAPDHASSLGANFLDGAQSLVTATSLLAHNVGPSYDSDLGGPGDFIFTGWGVKEGPIDWNKYIECSVTAIESIKFGSLKYSFFGGLWSNMGGPRGVIVQASRDGFASNVTTVRSGGWNVQQTLPWITDCPNDFIDDLTTLGQLNAGQTMTFRFYAVYTDYGHIPGGFWNKSVNDYNPTFEVTAAPEPATLILIGLGGMLLRKRK